MIRFLLNGQNVESADPPGLLVLDWLRRRRGLSGTKEGCKEGDCGACGVLLGELAGLSDGEPEVEPRVEYRPMTSCLMPLAQLEGRHLVTIEGLDLGGGRLNPVQKAIVERGGSQCGFCTPGIVVSLTGLLMQPGEGQAEHEVAQGLSGHLCRCTGYRSLKEAGADALAAVPERGIPAMVQSGTLPPHFAAAPQLLAALAGAGEDAAPPPEATVIGGGTDLYVQRGEDLPSRPVRVLPRAAEPVRREGESLHVAAAATFQQLAEDALLREALPELPQWMEEIASWQIRNRATLGGNIVNASPIGDLSILFLAWNAQLTLELAGAERTMPMAAFYLGYKKTALRSGEILKTVSVEAPLDLVAGWEKVAKRRALDIATVNLALTFRRGGDGQLRQVGLAAGGVAPVPLFLERSAALLEGARLEDGTASHALAAEILTTAQQEIAPISDVRGSADYKRLLVRQLLIAQLPRHFPVLRIADFYPTS